MALIKDEIRHEDFTTIINEEKNYRELKESIKMMKTQRSYNFIEQGKRKDIDKIIR